MLLANLTTQNALRKLLTRVFYGATNVFVAETIFPAIEQRRMKMDRKPHYIIPFGIIREKELGAENRREEEELPDLNKLEPEEKLRFIFAEQAADCG